MTTLLTNGNLQEACDRLENVAGYLESWADTDDRIADNYVIDQDFERVKRHRNMRDNYRIQARMIRESVSAINDSDARRRPETVYTVTGQWDICEDISSWCAYSTAVDMADRALTACECPPQCVYVLDANGEILYTARPV